METGSAQGLSALRRTARTNAALLLSLLLASERTARAQQPSEPAPSSKSVVEQGPPPRKPPTQEPLVVQPPAKPQHAVNALPLVSLNAPPPLVWKWPTFSTADYVITGTGGVITLAGAIIKPRAQHSLSGPIGFDSNVRSALRAGSLPSRYRFRDASDVGLSLALSWPFVSDALTTAWWYRGSREAAQEMALIDLEALAVAGALQGATNVLVSRERPFGKDCGSSQLPGDAIDCDGSFHYRSFFSGHATFSFTGAALICAHHFENELLGAPWDALSCAGAYAVATTTATFRVVADMHYASDVLLGATVGTLVGYSVPLLHYRKLGGASRLRDRATDSGSLQLNLMPAPGGIGVLGIF